MPAGDPTGVDFVGQFIQAFDGGHSGVNLDYTLGITIAEIGHLVITLTDLNETVTTYDLFITERED